jgi:hypothetical protein
MPRSLLTGQLKEKPTYRVWCLYSSFVHVGSNHTCQQYLNPSVETVSLKSSLIQTPRHCTYPGALVPRLVLLLGSPHLALRRAATACLRQLVQRESKEVSYCFFYR